MPVEEAIGALWDELRARNPVEHGGLGPPNAEQADVLKLVSNRIQVGSAGTHVRTSSLRRSRGALAANSRAPPPPCLYLLPLPRFFALFLVTRWQRCFCQG